MSAEDKPNPDPKEFLAAYKDSLKQEVDQLMKSKLIENSLEIKKERESFTFFRDLELKNLQVKAEANGFVKSNGLHCGDSEESRKEPEVPTILQSNTEILQAVEKIQKLITKFNKSMYTIKYWLELQVGKLETGNTFKSDVVSAVASKIYDEISGLGLYQYLLNRGNLIKKFQKHGENIRDLALGVEAMDYTYSVELERCMRGLEHSYALVYDILLKNWETISECGGNQKNESCLYQIN